MNGIRTKTLILPVLLLVITGQGIAQEKEAHGGGDTTQFKIGKTSIIFIDSNPNGEIEFEKADQDSIQKDENWDAYIDFGINGYLSTANQLSLPATHRLMELDYARSTSFSIGTMLVDGGYIIKDRLMISPGFGIQTCHYSFRNNIRLSTNDDSVSFNLDTLLDNSKYKLHVSYLQIPLVLTARIGNLDKPFGIHVGVIGSIKMGSNIRQRYTYGGANHKVKTRDDFNLNPFKLEGIVRLTIQDVGIFARYSFTHLFEKNKGPEVIPFAIGITFGEFDNRKHH